jgi:hypothetical protein
MTDKPNNPLAFPFPAERNAWGDGIREGSDGMTLRDYFAAQALSGVLTAPLQSPHWEVINSAPGDPSAAIANMVYGTADAMLLARTKAPHHDG